MSEANQMPIMLEKARLNLWNLIVVAAGIAVTAFGWGVTYSIMTAANETATKDIAAVQADIKDIRAVLPAIATVQSKTDRLSEIVMENKAAMTATNARIDRVVESFGGKLDTISENINKIATRVEVLSSRIGEQPQRTSFTTAKGILK